MLEPVSADARPYLHRFPSGFRMCPRACISRAERYAKTRLDNVALSANAIRFSFHGRSDRRRWRQLRRLITTAQQRLQAVVAHRRLSSRCLGVHQRPPRSQRPSLFTLLTILAPAQVPYTARQTQTSHGSFSGVREAFELEFWHVLAHTHRAERAARPNPIPIRARER
jgi:hypothetical protein